MGNWIPNDPTLVAQILKISSAYTPPPPEGFVSPMTWGIESNVIERFAGAGVPAEKIFFARDTFTFNYPSPPAALVDKFRKYYGPTMNAFEAAEKNGRAADLQNELEELFNRQNQSPRKDARHCSALKGFKWQERSRSLSTKLRIPTAEHPLRVRCSRLWSAFLPTGAHRELLRTQEFEGVSEKPSSERKNDELCFDLIGSQLGEEKGCQLFESETLGRADRISTAIVAYESSCAARTDTKQNSNTFRERHCTHRLVRDRRRTAQAR